MRYLLAPVLFLVASAFLVQQGITDPGFPGNGPGLQGPTANLTRIVGVGGVVGWEGDHIYSTPYNASRFCFADFSDVHIGDPWTQNLTPLREAVRNIAAITPAFAIATGDSADNGWPTELETYKDLMAGLGVPYYTVPGNHDRYSDPYLAGFRAFVGPPNFTFDFLGHLFVGVDTSTPRLTQGHLFPDRMAWLRGVLDSARGRARTITLFSHHGPVQHPTAAAEPMFGKLGGPRIPGIPILRERDALLEMLAEYPVNLYIDGHEHLIWEETRGRTLFLVTGDFGSKPYDTQPVEPTPFNGYRLICYENDRVTFHEMVHRDGGLTVNVSADGKEVRIRNTFASDYPMALVKLPVCRGEPVQGGYVQAVDRKSCMTYVGTTLPAGGERVVRVAPP